MNLYTSKCFMCKNKSSVVPLLPLSGTLKSLQELLSWSCPDLILFSPTPSIGSLLHPTAVAIPHDPHQTTVCCHFRIYKLPLLSLSVAILPAPHPGKAS